MVGPWRSRLHLVHIHILHGIWKSALRTVGTLNGIVLCFLIRTAGYLPLSLHLLFIPDSSFVSVVWSVQTHVWMDKEEACACVHVGFCPVLLKIIWMQEAF